METTRTEQAGSGSSPEPDEPLATPGDRPDPHGHRARFLKRSRKAVPPLYVADYLADRPDRCSGLTDPDALREYHRARQKTRGHEALTPGLDCVVALLPVVHRHDGRWRFAPGAFAMTSTEILCSPSYSLAEKHAWTYLLNHRRPDVFAKTGQIVVDSVRLADIAATGPISYSTAGRATARLEAKGKLTKRRRGHGQTTVYTLHTEESGASVYPAGHARSARRRIEAFVAKALGDRRSAEALFLETTLGFRLHGHTPDSLLSLIWRRLDHLVEAQLAPLPPCRRGGCGDG